MRAKLIGHFEPCMTEIYLDIDARRADYIRTHPYLLDGMGASSRVGLHLQLIIYVARVADIVASGGKLSIDDIREATPRTHSGFTVRCVAK